MMECLHDNGSQWRMGRYCLFGMAHDQLIKGRKKGPATGFMPVVQSLPDLISTFCKPEQIVILGIDSVFTNRQIRGCITLRLQVTVRTSQSARLMIPEATDPSTLPGARRPWQPRTIRSTSSSCAKRRSSPLGVSFNR